MKFACRAVFSKCSPIRVLRENDNKGCLWPEKISQPLGHPGAKGIDVCTPGSHQAKLEAKEPYPRFGSRVRGYKVSESYLRKTFVTIDLSAIKWPNSKMVCLPHPQNT